jgi:hypothetical protein
MPTRRSTKRRTRVETGLRCVVHCGRNITGLADDHQRLLWIESRDIVAPQHKWAKVGFVGNPASQPPIALTKLPPIADRRGFSVGYRRWFSQGK